MGFLALALFAVTFNAVFLSPRDTHGSSSAKQVFQSDKSRKRQLAGFSPGNTCQAKNGATDVQGDRYFNPRRRKLIMTLIGSIQRIMLEIKRVRDESSRIAKTKMELYVGKAKLTAAFQNWRKSVKQAAHRFHERAKETLTPIKLHFHSSGSKGSFSIASLRRFAAEYLDNPERLFASIIISTHQLGGYTARWVRFSQTIRGRMLTSGFGLSTVFFIEGIKQAVRDAKHGQLWTIEGVLLSIGLGLQVIGVAEDVYNTVTVLQYFGRTVLAPAFDAAMSSFLFARKAQQMTFSKVVQKYVRTAWSAFTTKTAIGRATSSFGSAMSNAVNSQKLFTSLSIAAFMRQVRPVVLGLDAIVSGVWLVLSTREYIKNQDPETRDPDLDGILIAQISLSTIGMAVAAGAIGCAVAGALTVGVVSTILVTASIVLNILLLPLMVIGFIISFTLMQKYYDDIESHMFSIYMHHFGRQVLHLREPSFPNVGQDNVWHDMPAMDGSAMGQMWSYIPFEEIIVNEHDYVVSIDSKFLAKLRPGQLNLTRLSFALDNIVLPANYYELPGYAYCNSWGWGRRLQSPSVALQKLRSGKNGTRHERIARDLLYASDKNDVDCPRTYQTFGRDLDFEMPKLKGLWRKVRIRITKRTLIITALGYASKKDKDENTVDLRVAYEILLEPEVKDSPFVPAHYTLFIPEGEIRSKFAYEMQYSNTDTPLLLTLHWNDIVHENTLSWDHLVRIAQQFLLPENIYTWHTITVDLLDGSRSFTFKSKSTRVAFQLFTRFGSFEIDWESRTFALVGLTCAMSSNSDNTMVSMLEVLRRYKEFGSPLRYCDQCAPFTTMWKPVSVVLDTNRQRSDLFFNPSRDFGVGWSFVCPSYLKQDDTPLHFRCHEIQLLDHLYVISAIPFTHGLRVTYNMPELGELIVLYPPIGIPEIKGARCSSCSLVSVTSIYRRSIKASSLRDADPTVLVQFSEQFFIRDTDSNITRMYDASGNRDRFLAYNDTEQFFLAYFKHGDCYFTRSLPSKDQRSFTVTRSAGYGNEDPMFDGLEEEIEPPDLPNASDPQGWIDVVVMEPYIILTLRDGTRTRSGCYVKNEWVVASFDPTTLSREDYTALVQSTAHPPEAIVFDSVLLTSGPQRMLWTEGTYVDHPSNGTLTFQYIGFFDALSCYLFINEPAHAVCKEATCVKRFIADPCPSKLVDSENCGPLALPSAESVHFFVKEDTSEHFSLYGKDGLIRFLMMDKGHIYLRYYISFDSMRHKVHLSFVRRGMPSVSVYEPRLPILYLGFFITGNSTHIEYRGCKEILMPLRSQLVSNDDVLITRAPGQIAGVFRTPENLLMNLIYDEGESCHTAVVPRWKVHDVESNLFTSLVNLEVTPNGRSFKLPMISGISVIHVTIHSEEEELVFERPTCDPALVSVVLAPMRATHIMFNTTLLMDDPYEIQCSNEQPIEVTVSSFEAAPVLNVPYSPERTASSWGCDLCGQNEVCVLHKYCENVTVFYHILLQNLRALPITSNVVKMDIYPSFSVCVCSRHADCPPDLNQLVVVRVKTYERMDGVHFCDPHPNSTHNHNCTDVDVELRYYLYHRMEYPGLDMHLLRGRQFTAKYSQIIFRDERCDRDWNPDYEKLAIPPKLIFPVQKFCNLTPSCAMVISWNENPAHYLKRMNTAYHFMALLNKGKVDVRHGTLVHFVHLLYEFLVSQYDANVFAQDVCARDFMISLYESPDGVFFVPGDAQLMWLPTNVNRSQRFAFLNEHVRVGTRQRAYRCPDPNPFVIPDCMGGKKTQDRHLGCMIRTLLHFISPQNVRPSVAFPLISSAAQELDLLHEFWKTEHSIASFRENKRILDSLLVQFPHMRNCQAPVFGDETVRRYLNKNDGIRKYKFLKLASKKSMYLSNETSVDGTCPMVRVVVGVMFDGRPTSEAYDAVFTFNFDGVNVHPSR